jgi:dipeptidase E
MNSIILASTSTIHGGSYLSYLSKQIEKLFSSTDEIVFIPYARPDGMSHDEYTQIAQGAFDSINKRIVGLHTYDDPIKAITNAKGIFTGGGNTFLLVSQLYKFDLIQTIREAVLDGTPYLGTSAGSNICGITMGTTNDMPIAYPPSFKTLGLVPFNINPHYIDPDPNSKHMGETRETRIKEYLTQNSIPVIGLREGSWIRVKGDSTFLRGQHHARVFEQGKDPKEIPSGSVLNDLK